MNEVKSVECVHFTKTHNVNLKIFFFSSLFLILIIPVRIFWYFHTSDISEIVFSYVPNLLNHSWKSLFSPLFISFIFTKSSWEWRKEIAARGDGDAEVRSVKILLCICVCVSAVFFDYYYIHKHLCNIHNYIYTHAFNYIYCIIYTVYSVMSTL